MYNIAKIVEGESLFSKLRKKSGEGCKTETEIVENQYRLMPGRRTTDARFPA